LSSSRCLQTQARTPSKAVGFARLAHRS
jgi:hypothetical protein